MIDNYAFERRGRTPLTGIVLAGVYLGLICVLYFLSVSIWVVAVLFLFTVPAIWDLIMDTRSGMTITKQEIEWSHGRKSVTIPMQEVDRMIIDLRLDRSVKLRVLLKNGRKIRVTQPSIPPLKELEGVLTDLEIPYRKNPFSLL